MGGSIPDTFVSDLVARTDLLSLVREHVDLKKAGPATWKGLCPFHNEKTPSFHVRPLRGSFKCFGCEKGGDAISFVRELNGYSFVEAIEILAERSGLEVPREQGSRPGPARSAGGKRALLDALDAAQAFFRQQGARAPVFREFLTERGLSDEVAERFGLGLAPDAWDTLGRHLASKRIPGQAALDAGLLRERQHGGGHYDVFRNRVTFPVHDLGSRVVGFSARALDPEAPGKYINSPETPVYRKSRLLFGLPFAREGLRGGQAAVLVEGNVDVVRLHGVGVTTAIAPLGTALTTEQCDSLKRLCDAAVLFFDGDDAGAKASRRAIPLLLGAGLDVRVARPPDGLDPDDLAGRGADDVAAVLGAAEDAIDHLTDALRRVHGPSDAGRSRALNECLDAVIALPEAAAQHAAAWRVHRALGLDGGVTDASLRRRLDKQRERGRRPPREEPDEMAPIDVAPVSAAPVEQDLLALLLDHPDYLVRFVDDGWTGRVSSKAIRRILERGAGLSVELSPAEEGLRATIAVTAPPLQGMSIEDAYGRFVRELERTWIGRESMRLQSERDRAERTGDAERAARLRSEIMDLARRLGELRRSG